MSAASESVAEIGGFSLGRNAWLAINGSWPFAALRISTHELVLDVWWRRYRFPRSSIIRLFVFSRFFSPGLRIEHSVSQYPRFVVFWSFRMSRVRWRLAEARFSVDGANT